MSRLKLVLLQTNILTELSLFLLPTVSMLQKHGVFILPRYRKSCGTSHYTTVLNPRDFADKLYVLRKSREKWLDLIKGCIYDKLSGCPRGVMLKAMDCGTVVSEFVLQSRYYVHFRTNTFGKGMNPLILPAMG